MSYSRLIGALKTKNVVINRKMLSELAIRDFNAFKAVVDSVK
jgi:large subunit ribosomal protein L20